MERSKDVQILRINMVYDLSILIVISLSTLNVLITVAADGGFFFFHFLQRK